MTKVRFLLVAGAAMATLAFGMPAAAHPDHQDGDKQVREIKIVKVDGKSGTAIEKVVEGGEMDRSDFVANCGKGRKFESGSSSESGDKEKKVSKMVICSDPGESDEEWANTLKEALARVEGSDDLPSEGKAQIVADLKSEIAKLGK